MSSQKLLVVFGVTGNQGGSIVNSVLNDPILSKQFAIRGVTRDPTKPNAVALTKKGVTLVKADLEDKDSLRVALDDAHTVFAVTNWQEILNKEKEIQLGKNIADIVKELDIKHLIWSSCPDATKISSGKVPGVLHFDSKAVVQEYITSLNIPATHLQLSIFMEFIPPMLVPVAPKTYKLMAPMPIATRIPMICVKNDTGKYVKAILCNAEKYIGKTIIAGENEYSMQEVAAIVAKTAGLDVEAVEITDEQYRGALGAYGMPEFLVDDMAQMMQFIKEYGFFGGATLDRDHSILNQPLTTFEEWVASSEALSAMK